MSRVKTDEGTISIGGRAVGGSDAPLLVAEMSANHNHSLDRALALVDAAAAAGAHAIKLQTLRPSGITLDCDADDFIIRDPKSLWNGRRLFELYQDAATPWEWHGPIFERAQERGIACFSAPFDESAVDFLEELDCPAYKIASFEIVHNSLLRKVARTGKPVVVSTGMASAGEIEEAVGVIRGEGNERIVLLKCTSTYPADPADTDLRTIPHMSSLFRCPVGLSDHTQGIGASVASVAFGACLIEKHLTLSRADGGVDAAFSLEPAEFSALSKESTRAWAALGGIAYGPSTAERASLQFRRSLYVSKDLKAGGALTDESLAVVRPGFGLHPRYYELLLGSVVRTDARAGTPVSWELLGLKAPDDPI
jgi:pseudaminic acid synthase